MIVDILSLIYGMRAVHILTLGLVANWAAAAPAQNIALEKRQTIGVSNCWCCEIALQPHGNFYGAGTGCKAGVATCDPAHKLCCTAAVFLPFVACIGPAHSGGGGGNGGTGGGGG
ncbi:uncharacterized protein N7458_004375 [Penicillium daleae]|uniref:Uncharacterized protein n=1 Tax=Penicillium daleae TaxID=63821 RepID=A0AAD6C6F2_9EURO|nr:uncharacterized protein N7458_004375 [Penicillium daleae]KAJ5453419.1 hypothetical protein N7458_004375 [Penicillium daleae]